MPQPPSDPNAPRPAAEPHEKLLERVERLSEFGAQMANTLRAEFIYFWDRADRRAQVPESAAFVLKVDALRNLTARYLRETARAKHLPPVQAMHLLRTLDLGELLEAGRGLEATARGLRERAREFGWSTGRLSGSNRQTALPWTDQDGWVRLFSGIPTNKEVPDDKPRGGWLTGRLQSMVERIALVPAAEKKSAPPPPPPPGVRRLQAFEGALGLVKDLIEETEPRIATLRVALIDGGAYTRPPADAKSTLTRVPPELKQLLPAATQAVAATPTTRRMALVAVNQWDHASKLLEEFERARDAAKKVAPDQVGEVLRPFQIDKLKGLIMPLTNLHVTFRGVAGLAPLFPPPVARRIEANLPEREIVRPGDPDAEPEAKADATAEAPAPKFGPEETSKRRLGLIMAYLTDPGSVPELEDETLVFRLVAEEHAYQEDKVIDLGMRIRLLPAPGTPEEQAENDARREQMAAALDEARQNRAHLQELLGFMAQQRTDAGGTPKPE